MDITAHIRELLFGHDCVILPGFGGFIGNYAPARIDKATSTFHPPLKRISFNRNLNHNDGLLIGKISGSTGLNYGDSRNLVGQFTDEISVRLSKGEKVVFDHIGSFTLNHEGNIQFEPDSEANYHLNSYGLTSFQFMPLEGYDVRKKIVSPRIKESVKQPAFRKYLWRAAVIVPLLGVLVAVPLTTDLFRTKVQSTSLNPLAAVEFDSNREELSSPSNLEITAIQPGQTAVVPAEAGTPQVDMPAGQFYLITGSFQSENNAAILVKQLKEEGYNPEIINGPNGFYRVSAMRCSSIDEANRKKDSIGRKYSGTWITKTR